MGESVGDSPAHLLLDQLLTERALEQVTRAFEKRDAISATHLRQVLAGALNRDQDDQQIALLCAMVSGDGSDVVLLEEFSSYLLRQLKEREKSQQLSGSHSEAMPLQPLPHCKRNTYSKETICRIVPISNPAAHYLAVSKDGVLTTWSHSLQLKSGKCMDQDSAPLGGQRASLLVTDMVGMHNCGKVCLSSSSRELHFYDCQQGVRCFYRLHDLPYVPLCLSYHYNIESPSSSSHLLYGDEAGSVVVLSFLKPTVALFQPSSFTDKPTQLIAFKALSEHALFVSVQVVTGVHSDWVGRVSYLPHNHSFVSCSSSSSHSIVLQSIHSKTRPYVFKMSKGALCFVYSHELDLLVSGSRDHLVRLWNPVMPHRPVAVLAGHSTAVLDLVLCRRNGLLYSFSLDSVLYVWDVFRQTPLQSIKAHFPPSHRLPDYGPSPLTFLPPHTLTLACNEHLLVFEGVGAGAEDTLTPSHTTHRHPLCKALYNPLLHQVISGSECGDVLVWDVNSGQQLLSIPCCHGNEELTSMSLDATGRRFLTGSRNGQIKVWTCGTGVCVGCMSAPGGTEVTSVLHRLELGGVLAVGWSHRITFFPDTADASAAVEPSSTRWQGPDHHKDDILCSSYCFPNYLATGSFDGEIAVWNTATERLVSHCKSISRLKPMLLKKIKQLDVTSASHSTLTSTHTRTPSQPASRKLSSYCIRSSQSLCRVPVDQLLFLCSRLEDNKKKRSASLVSSEAGIARFWDIFSTSEPLGSFPLTECREACVLALATDASNAILAAGDTSGLIAVFNIQHYCTGHCPSQSTVEPVARWQAHGKEVLSLECVSHEALPLLLSASGDCSVQLWDLQGHCLGMFGQGCLWDLHKPSSFQHPANMVTAEDTQKQGIESEKVGVSPLALSRAGSGSVSVGEGVEVPPHNTEQALTDQSLLGEVYGVGMRKRIANRQGRRMQYADVDLQKTERFGSLCSAFQALEIQGLVDVATPKGSGV